MGSSLNREAASLLVRELSGFCFVSSVIILCLRLSKFIKIRSAGLTFFTLIGDFVLSGSNLLPFLGAYVFLTNGFS